MRAALIGAPIGASGTAHGQAPPTNGRLVFEFDRVVVTPQDPSVTLTVSAAWDEAMPNDHAFSGADYDLVAGSGAFTGADLLLGDPMVNTPGSLDGARVNGAIIGQLVICSVAGCFFSVDNPIALAEYTWETTDFTPRTVRFDSEGTTRFLVAPIAGGPTIQLFPGQFTAGSGSITVVPGPAGALGLVAMSAFAGRRRR